jgi:predicted ATPase
LATANAGEPEALATTLAAALQIPTGAGELKRQVVGYLRQRELLLILDNLEHLLDDIGWLSELLAAAPDVKILATSRERLNLQAEQVIHLGGLPTPAADHTAPEQFAAVALFARRARRVQPDFALTPQIAPAVIQICQSVGGLPLGIELAAAWVSRYSCPDIAAAIVANLDFLDQHPPRRFPAPAQPARRIRPLLAPAARAATGVRAARRLPRQFHARRSRRRCRRVRRDAGRTGR